jgi:hypothetical protein
MISKRDRNIYRKRVLRMLQRPPPCMYYRDMYTVLREAACGLLKAEYVGKRYGRNSPDKEKFLRELYDNAVKAFGGYTPDLPKDEEG